MKLQPLYLSTGLRMLRSVTQGGKGWEAWRTAQQEAEYHVCMKQVLEEFNDDSFGWNGLSNESQQKGFHCAPHHVAVCYVQGIFLLIRSVLLTMMMLMMVIITIIKPVIWECIFCEPSLCKIYLFDFCQFSLSFSHRGRPLNI